MRAPGSPSLRNFYTALALVWASGAEPGHSGVRCRLGGREARMASVCVVGAGISGVACARVLREAGLEVDLRDRSHAPGGRMSSPRMTWSTLGDRRIDTGAGYFTVRDDEFRAQVDDWVARDLAREWTDTFHLLPA